MSEHQLLHLDHLVGRTSGLNLSFTLFKAALLIVLMARMALVA